METKESDLSYTVIGKAMEVHRKLGPGLDEVFYHELLSRKLEEIGIDHQFKPRACLIHRGRVADRFEADLIVRGVLVLELKRLWEGFVPKHYAQIISYLKFWNITTGLLFDFGKESLVQKRIAFSNTPPPRLCLADVVAAIPDVVSDKALAAALRDRIFAIYSTHGLGYCDTTYCGLLNADFVADGVDFTSEPTVCLRCDGEPIGEAKLGCMAIQRQCAILVLALRETIRAADRAILQTYLRHFGIPWGLIVNFGKRRLELKFVVHPCSY